MTARLLLVCAPAALLLATAAGAQPIGPPAPPPPAAADPECEQEEAADSEEIVVCGKREEADSPYRIPRQFRGREAEIADRDASWGARQRDLDSVQQYGSQNVGSAGWLQNARQRDCEWRADRQRAQGRQPDCTRRVRPNEATDWERR